MATLTALALPPIMLVALGAVQLQAVVTDRTRTQDVADSAALWGAQQLTVTPVGAETRTQEWADAQLGAVKANATTNVQVQVVGPNTIKVSIDTHRPSFFFNLLPAGGFHTHTEAIAEGASIDPLCVINFGQNSSDKAEITNNSKMLAPKCRINVNQRLEVAGSALLQAQRIEVGVGASGPMNPSADVGAPPVPDPFATLDIQGSGGAWLGCLIGSLLPKLMIMTDTTLPAGSHCRDIEVKNGITLTLGPGEHYFEKALILKNSARLIGDDVALVYGKDAVNDWKMAATVRLTGRRSGRLAGFVIAATRDRGNELKIDSDAVTELTGTIYVPNATLNIEGSKQAVQNSDWTVMATKALKLTNQPQVQINANYSGSQVPVPGGVGNRAGATRLTK